MSSSVIQGTFLAGRPRLTTATARPSPTARPAGPTFPANAIQPRPAHPPAHAPAGGAPQRVGPPAPAFAAQPRTAQSRTAQSRPTRPASDGDAMAVDASLLRVTRPGRPLPEAVQRKMEQAFGADFAGVRIHEGPQAESIGAIAFTVGSDIYFAPGRFQPQTAAGQQLLGHELAHVLQQRAGRVRNPLGAGLAVVQDHALEAEADRLGHRAASWQMPAQRGPAADAMKPTGRPAQDKCSVQCATVKPPALDGTRVHQVLDAMNRVQALMHSPELSARRRGGAIQPGLARAQVLASIPRAPSVWRHGSHVTNSLSLQAKLTVYWDKGLNAYQLEGRPDFTASLKKDLFQEADNDGESYIVKFSSDNGLSFQFPSVHRRHKLAWSLWRAAVNQILASGDEQDLTDLMKKCFVSGEYQKWSKTDFKNAYSQGYYLADMAKDFFNHPDNIWLGPGDENMGKGGGLDKQIAAYVQNPTKKARKAVKQSAFDPHNKNSFEFVEPDPMNHTSGGWEYYDIPQTPRSDQMEKATDHILDKVFQ